MSDPDYTSCWTRQVSYVVRADRPTVFNLIAEVELWPALFRHVRSARVLRRNGRRRLIAVRVRWKGVPLGYTAIQTIDDGAFETTIRHLSPLTRGSIVRWSLLPAADNAASAHPAVELRLEQTMTVRLPLVGGILARGVIGGQVARDLGHLQARRVQEIAEGGSLAGRD
jgi:ribosome-associated toxin RatA of RatAB toxin-antitoxin module